MQTLIGTRTGAVANSMAQRQRRLTVATGLASAGLGTWEVGLTRLAGLLYSRTLAYQALAVALVGLGVGAWLASRRLSGARGQQQDAGLDVASAALNWLAPALVIGAAACLQGDTAWGLGAFAWPFVVFGVVLAGVWHACRPGGAAARRRQYRWELIGAAVGLALLGPMTVAWAGSVATVWVGGGLCAVASLIMTSQTKTSQPMTSRITNGRLWLSTLVLALPMAALAATALHHPPLTLPLRDGPGNQHHLRRILKREHIDTIQTRHSAWARTDWLQSTDAHMSWILADGRFVARSVTWDGQRRTFACARVERLARLKRLPWRVRPDTNAALKALIIGSGGGFDVAVALQEGAKKVVAIELNAHTIAFAREDAARNAHIYDRAGVEVVIADGRRWAQHHQQRFDHIQLALMETAPGGVRGRSTAHGRLLTVEALRLWRSRLRPRGILTLIFNSEQHWRDAMAQVAAAYGGDWQAHTWATRLRKRKGRYNPFSYVLLYSSSPWTEADARRLRLQARRARALPGLSQTALRAAVSSADVAAAVTDDRPPPPTPEQSSLELLLTGIAALLAILVAGRRLAVARIRYGAMFAGVALTWLQVGVVEWMTAATGAPALAIGVAIAAMLLGAALGTALPWRGRATWWAAAAAVALGLAGPPLATALSGWQVEMAAAVFFAVIALISLPLGAPWMMAMTLASGPEIRSFSADVGAEASRAEASGEGPIVAADGLGAVMGAGVSGLLLHHIGLQGGCYAAAVVLLCVATLLRRAS